MAKHTQTIRQILLSVFDHSVGLAPKGLTTFFNRYSGESNVQEQIYIG